MQDDTENRGSVGSSAAGPSAAASPVAASPCVGICSLDAGATHCTGCLRTLEEIASWSRLDEARRHTMLGELRERRRVAAAAPAPDAMPEAEWSTSR